MRFRFIEQHADTWPVRLRCRVLAVSPSGYYGWRSRPESARSATNRELLDDVRRIHAATMAATGRFACMRLCGRKADRRAAGVWSA